MASHGGSRNGFHIKRIALTAGAALVSVWLAGAASSGPPSVVQPRGSTGCLNRDGSAGCAKARGIAEPLALAASPDGKNLYAAGGVGSLGAVGAFARDPSTGALRQLAGRAGCLSRLPSRACGTGRGLETPAAIAVAPDGRTVAIAARNGSTIGLYRREASGALRAVGCVQTRATSGCREAPGLEEVAGLAFAAEGRILLAATRSGLVSFRSDMGRLSFVQLARSAGARAVAVAPDSAFAYVVGGGGRHGWLETFAVGRDGALTDLHCVGQNAPAGCETTAGLEQPAGVAVARDGRHVYVVSTVSAAVVTFTRSADGQLGSPRVARGRAFASATAIAAGRGGVYVTTRKLLTALEPSDGTVVVAQTVRPRGVSDLTAVTIVGRNAYVAGRGLAVLRLA